MIFSAGDDSTVLAISEIVSSRAARILGTSLREMESGAVGSGHASNSIGQGVRLVPAQSGRVFELVHYAFKRLDSPHLFLNPQIFESIPTSLSDMILYPGLSPSNDLQ